DITPTPDAVAPAGGDAAGEAGVGAGVDAAPLTPTFTNVYTTILQSCGTTASAGSSCHGSPSGGVVSMSQLDFSSQMAAYSGLYNVPAMGEYCSLPPDGGSVPIRVVPSSASTSLLYEKVAQTTPPCGKTMPQPIMPATTVAPL